MNKMEVEGLIDSYYEWLRRNTRQDKWNEWNLITTPYFDTNGDYIQICIKESEDGFLLSDDGATMEFKATNPQIKLARRVLLGYGAYLEDGSLQIKANADNLILKMHDLIHSMLVVNLALDVIPMILQMESE